MHTNCTQIRLKLVKTKIGNPRKHWDGVFETHQKRIPLSPHRNGNPNKIKGSRFFMSCLHTNCTQLILLISSIKNTTQIYLYNFARKGQLT